MKFVKTALTRENYRSVLEPLLDAGDFLLNLSVDVSSVALVQLARERGALYLDTCIEPWAGGYTDPQRVGGLAQQLHHAPGGIGAARRRQERPHGGADAWRESRAWSRTWSSRPCSTSPRIPAWMSAGRGSRESWAKLAQTLGIKVMHVAERDTQVTNVPKAANEFVNTWSVDGFVSEGAQPAELGWGTHERHFPADGGRHKVGLGLRHLFESSRRQHPGAHLDTRRRDIFTAS